MPEKNIHKNQHFIDFSFGARGKIVKKPDSYSGVNEVARCPKIHKPMNLNDIIDTPRKFESVNFLLALPRRRWIPPDWAEAAPLPWQSGHEAGGALAIRVAKGPTNRGM